MRSVPMAAAASMSASSVPVNRLTRILCRLECLNGFFEQVAVLGDIPSVIRSECTWRVGYERDLPPPASKNQLQKRRRWIAFHIEFRGDHLRSSRTSAYVMWRSSGRGWTVIPEHQTVGWGGGLCHVGNTSPTCIAQGRNLLTLTLSRVIRTFRFQHLRYIPSVD